MFMHASAGYSKTCDIRDIRLKDVSGKVLKPSSIMGSPERPMGSFYFDNVEIDTTMVVRAAPNLHFSGRNGIRTVDYVPPKE